MDRVEALSQAKEIAKMITAGVRKLGRTRLGEVGLFGLLPFLAANKDAKEGKDIDIKALNPRIFEILIFGSIAQGKEEVGDIDMMILDTGFFSRFFSSGCQTDDWYKELSSNAWILMTDWLDLDIGEVEAVLKGYDVDLHVLPLKMLGSVGKRKEIAAKHKDPQFLRNCFASMLRFDGATEGFVPVTLEYFEKRYHASLSDLK